MKSSAIIKTIIFVVVAVALLYGANSYNKRLDEEAVLSRQEATQLEQETARSEENKKQEIKKNMNINDVRVGSGPEAKVGDQITVNYEGTFMDGKKFDSSYDRGEPITFGLIPGQLIEGWIVGIPGMKVGGKRTFTVPWQLGYGEQGNPMGGIEPKTDLNFSVELLAVNGKEQ